MASLSPDEIREGAEPGVGLHVILLWYYDTTLSQQRWNHDAIMRYLPYSWKIRQGLKLGGLAVGVETAKLKSANIFTHNV